MKHLLRLLLWLGLFSCTVRLTGQDSISQDTIKYKLVSCYAPIDYSHYDKPFYEQLFKIIKHNPVNLGLLPYRNRGEIAYQNLFDKYQEQDVYNPYEGLQALHHRLYAEGFVENKDKSFAWGRAVYERNANQATLGRDVLDYERFYPYLVSERKGGDYQQELYSISGAYTKAFDKLSLSFSGLYTGAVGYRLADPRPENRVSSYKLAFGTGYNLGTHSLALGFSFNHYQQDFDVMIRQAGKQELFYSMRGLGLYDYMYSVVSDSYQRYLYANKHELTLSYLPSRKHLILSGGILAQLSLSLDQIRGVHSHEREVNTLERAELKSYLAYILPSEIDLKFSNSSAFSYSIGLENQYEQYLVHRNPDIIGYKLLVKNRNHRLVKFTNTFDVSYQHRLAYHFKLLANYLNFYSYYSESYRQDYHYRLAKLGNELSLGAQYIPYTASGIYLTASFDWGHRKALSEDKRLPLAGNASEAYPISLSLYYYDNLSADYNFLGSSLRLMRRFGDYRVELKSSYRKYLGALSRDCLNTQLTFIF